MIIEFVHSEKTQTTSDSHIRTNYHQGSYHDLRKQFLVSPHDYDIVHYTDVEKNDQLCKQEFIKFEKFERKNRGTNRNRIEQGNSTQIRDFPEVRTAGSGFVHEVFSSRNFHNCWYGKKCNQK